MTTQLELPGLVQLETIEFRQPMLVTDRDGSAVPTISGPAMVAVRAQFADWGHRPSEAQMYGLEQIARCIEAMAVEAHKIPEVENRLKGFDDSLYVSFAPCGMGKTTTLVQTVKEIVKIPQYESVGIIIFLSRRDEIEALVKEMDLDEADYSTIVGRDATDINAMGNPHKKTARVLFTTQKMLETLSKGKPFAKVYDYFYKGKPRVVRIWDEAILPSRTMALTRWEMDALKEPLSRFNDKLVGLIDDLSHQMRSLEDGELITIPDFEAETGVTEDLALSWLTKGHQAIEALYGLQGLTARIHVDKGASVSLQYADILPEDLAPALILDASGTQSATYQLWAQDRKGIKFLKSADKNYKGLTCHHWDIGVGKGTQAKNATVVEELASGIARTIDRDVPIGKKILIVHFLQSANHAKRGVDSLMDRIRAKVDPRHLGNIQATNWGRHTSTNEFQGCEYVFLAGIRQYRNDQYEVQGLAAKGQGVVVGLTREEHDLVRYGEICHHMLQASCRGSVRKAVGDGCPSGCHLYVAYCAKNLAKSGLFDRIFPGNTYKVWEPVYRRPKGKVQDKVLRAVMNAKGPVLLKSSISRMTGVPVKQINQVITQTTLLNYLLYERGIFFDDNDDQIVISRVPMGNASSVGKAA